MNVSELGSGVCHRHPQLADNFAVLTHVEDVRRDTTREPRAANHVRQQMSANFGGRVANRRCQSRPEISQVPRYQNGAANGTRTRDPKIHNLVL